jgi:hypothetical protein
MAATVLYPYPHDLSLDMLFFFFTDSMVETPPTEARSDLSDTINLSNSEGSH